MGFQLDRSQGDGDLNAKAFTYSVDAAHATAIAVGDVVSITGTGDADGNPYADVTTAGTGNSISGIVAGIEVQYAGENLTATAVPASTAGKVRVHVEPRLLFEAPIQDGAGTAGTLTVASIGQNVPLDATAASVSGGLTLSNMGVDGTGAVATTEQFRIVALRDDDGAGNFSTAIVRINESFINDTAGV